MLNDHSIPLVSIDPAALRAALGLDSLAEQLARVEAALRDGGRICEVEPVAVGERKAARLIDVSQSLLARLRQEGEGPAFIKVGARIVYPIDQLKTWAKERAAVGTVAENHHPINDAGVASRPRCDAASERSDLCEAIPPTIEKQPQDGRRKSTAA